MDMRSGGNLYLQNILWNYLKENQSCQKPNSLYLQDDNLDGLQARAESSNVSCIDLVEMPESPTVSARSTESAIATSGCTETDTTHYR